MLIDKDIAFVLHGKIVVQHLDILFQGNTHQEYFVSVPYAVSTANQFH